MQKQQTHFILACLLALLAFAGYQSFYGGDRNQAFASLSEGDLQNGMVNYKPARKRQLSSRLRKDMDQIFGLKGHDVIQIFDKPELVRRDLPTTIWQYRNDACVMDVYFTVGRADSVSDANVAHYEIRKRDTRAEQDVEASDCVQDLIANDTMISLIDIKSVFKASSL